MFETEAEEIEVKADEYALEESTACNYGESSKHVYQGYFYGFKKGAEFGYNKAMNEMQEQGLALQSDMDKTIEQNIALKKELEKANEWHYVKDGDLPKENEYILIYSKLADNIAVGKRRCAGKIRKRCVYEWYFATYEGTYCLKDKDIIAWKEIVPPSEPNSI